MDIKKVYLSHFKHVLPMFFPGKHRLFKDMDQYLDDYLDTHADVSLEEMIKDLDTPENAAALYLEENANEHVGYVKKQYILLIVAIVAAFLLAMYGGFIFIRNSQTATIIYETAVEVPNVPEAE